MHLCISFPEMFCYDFLNHITVHLNAVCCVLLYAVCCMLCVVKLDGRKIKLAQAICQH